MLLDCRKDVVSWTKKHNIRVNYDFDGKTKTYVPDFRVITTDGKTRIEEVKGLKDQSVILKENALLERCTREGWEYSYIDRDILSKTLDELGFMSFNVLINRILKLPQRSLVTENWLLPLSATVDHQGLQ
jgi:hypothetical protein